MTDKDLLVVISELLQKQDQQAEILNKQSGMIEETNKTLQKFMEVSIKQFEWQHENAEEQKKINERQQYFNERQQDFNERFLAKLDEISNKL
jgi:protein-tyrosine phosphatase